MEFLVRPKITSASSLPQFFTDWSVGQGDLIVTNEYLLIPQLNGAAPPCEVLYQENFGKGEPSDEMVDKMLASIEGKQFERIIAIGGGTVIDISKLFVFEDGLRTEEIFAKGASLLKQRKLIIIPTTCGTGSEVSNISILEFKKKNTKMGLAVPALFADEAVLIEGLLSTLPWEVFATSSIDALIHACESYVSPKANAFTRAMGRGAIEMILAGYQLIADSGQRKLPQNMGDFLIASTMAGISFGNAGCAAVHALSYPIGGNYHVPHGKANYLVFEEVFNTYEIKNADISPLIQVISAAINCAPNAALGKMFALLAKIYDRQPLAQLGADKAKCAEMAASVIQNQQRILANNPVQLSQEEIQHIYECCL